MASRIYEYSGNMACENANSYKTSRNDEQNFLAPVIAKGNAYQGITAQW